MKNKKYIKLLYLILIILELLGFINSIKEVNLNMFLYYTELSNLLLMISSIFKLIYLDKNKHINLLNYTSVLSTTITFLVVLFILGPSINFNYKFLLLEGSMLYHHFLCPIIGIILFLLLDKSKLNKKDIFNTLSFTCIYAFIFIILNILKIIEGPYFFLMVYKQSIFMSIMWFIIIFSLAYLISFILYLTKKRIDKNSK